MYRFYIRFSLLVEFDSIREAKQFAGKCRLSGVLNLMEIIIGIHGMFQQQQNRS